MYEKQMSHAANTNKRDDLTTGHMIQIVEIALISEKRRKDRQWFTKYYTEN
jgi:hypothetical protein